MAHAAVCGQLCALLLGLVGPAEGGRQVPWQSGPNSPGPEASRAAEPAAAAAPAATVRKRTWRDWFRGGDTAPAASEVPPAPAGPVHPIPIPGRSAPGPERRPLMDPPVQRTQVLPDGRPAPLEPGVAPVIPAPSVPAEATAAVGRQSVSLQAALFGTLTSNPDLATLRVGNPTTPSPEAVEVARHFPTALNPTLWCDLRPITLIPPDPFGGATARQPGGFYKWGQFYFYLSLRQPVELGHQTTHRYNIAKAAYDQQRWTVVQAELLALVQAYRFFETAAYRKERLKAARELAEFNERLSKTLERRLEANQVPAADVVLARVESRATRQLVKAAEQDYITALTDLRNQMGIPESAAAAEPLGEFTLPPFIPPANEQEYIAMALQNRPDIRAAQAAVAGTQAAECLARADQIPTPIIGPQYAMDEAGIQYIGLVYITPIPIWNTGAPLVRQRRADHRRAHQALQAAQQRAVAQVRSALARWNGASELVKESAGLTAELAREVKNLERLFDEGQADLGKLLQAQQRLIQLRTAEIDAVWAATQAQADLLLALGVPSLLQGMADQVEGAAAPAAAPVIPSSRPSPFQPGS